MKKEYREIFNLPPTLLYKNDLFDLENLLLNDDSPSKKELNIEITFGPKRYEGSSFEQLFKIPDIPTISTALSIRLTKWEKNNIVGGASLVLYVNFIHCQLHGLSEDWFEGKKARIKNFFQNRKPWYAFLNRAIPFIAPPLALLVLEIGVSKIKEGSLFGGCFYSALSLALATIIYFCFKNKLFPFVKIYLKEKKKTPLDLQSIAALVVIITPMFELIKEIFHFLSTK